MSADIYLATCLEPGTTDEAKSLTFNLPRSAATVGLPRQLTAELFPGVDPAPGNPLAAKPCRMVVRGITSPTRVQVRDHRDQQVAVREVRHSTDVTIPLTMLHEVIPYSGLKLELKPITAT